MKKSLITLSLLVIGSTVMAQQTPIDYFRAPDQSGRNQFETPKNVEETPFEGLRIRHGGAFTQQFQAITHENVADIVARPATELARIGNNFNNATANWSMDVQLAQGIRVSLVTYLSARHHQEAWVKGGYIQFDRLPFFPWEFVDGIMDFVTIKVGHMELNYGDSHFRRTDNGNAIYNPFVGNYILDAFNTEIGTEIYFQHLGFLGMMGISNGEIKGDVTQPQNKTGSLYFKGGYDAQLNENLRVRLTASYYGNERATTNNLYAGDRAGSRYYYVMENTVATATANFRSGMLNPSFGTNVSAFVINPFVKFMGLEIFANYEIAKGNSVAEVTAGKPQREITSTAVDVLYYLGENENFYVGGRYNTVSGQLVANSTPAATPDYSIGRMQFVGGWYVTPNVLAKLEYVTQEYNDFPATSILHKGKFSGVMFEAVVGF